MKKKSRKKIKLNKSYKKAAVLIIILLLLINLTLLSLEIFIDKYEDKKSVFFSCALIPNVSYDINLIPNIIYDVGSIGEDQGYFASLIDTISVEFTNEFKAQSEFMLEGEYDVTCTLTGMVIDATDPVVAWEKRFETIPKKTFYASDNSYNILEKLNIDFNFYNDYADEISDLIVYNTDNYLNINMDINYTITTEYGVIQENIRPGLIIPMGKDYFNIEKTGTEHKNDELFKTDKILAPIDYKMASLYIMISVILLIPLIVLFKFTTEPDIVDLKRKHMKKVFKQYGKRLVALEQDILKNIKARNMVHSINDMEKISDELEKPIFYIHKDDLSEISELFIMNGDEAFVCNIVKNFSSRQH